MQLELFKVKGARRDSSQKKTESSRVPLTALLGLVWRHIWKYVYLTEDGRSILSPIFFP